MCIGTCRKAYCMAMKEHILLVRHYYVHYFYYYAHYFEFLTRTKSRRTNCSAMYNNSVCNAKLRDQLESSNLC